MGTEGQHRSSPTGVRRPQHEDSHIAVRHINEISTASDLNKICERCENNFEVRSRSDVKTKLTVLQGVCATCQSIEEYERIKTADSERAELQERLAQTE